MYFSIFTSHPKLECHLSIYSSSSSHILNHHTQSTQCTARHTRTLSGEIVNNIKVATVQLLFCRITSNYQLVHTYVRTQSQYRYSTEIRIYGPMRTESSDSKIWRVPAWSSLFRLCMLYKYHSQTPFKEVVVTGSGVRFYCTNRLWV